jgi:secreted PhoX family phosphatase
MITFSNQSGVIGSAALAGGVATFTTSSLSVGTYTVTASYGGTAGFAPSSTDTIVTTVGNGLAGYAGNNGPAAAAELNNPRGIASDSAGNLFIADRDNNVVREVIKATGNIITVAGNGTPGYSGDNGPATAAELNWPHGIAVDSAGNLFIADTNNSVIREVVKATGKIITVAGNGTAGYSGDNGPATSATLTMPHNLIFDSAGNLIIADTYNNVIREVIKATGKIIAVAGNGIAGYSGDHGPVTAAELNTPIGLAFDSAGDLFFCDNGNNVVREVVKATGNIITIAGNGTAGYKGDNGPAAAAELNQPDGITFDRAGDLYFVEELNNVVREVVKATGNIITVAGDGVAGYSGSNGPATAAELNNPTRVAIDSSGGVLITDSHNHVVREITPAVIVRVTPPMLAAQARRFNRAA